MSIEAVKTWAARPWARQLATLQRRAAKPALRAHPSPLTEITEDALAVGVAMLEEMAQQHFDCDQLRSELSGQVAAWQHLFEIMPTACVITDEAGLVVEANRAAGLLFNISPKGLQRRPLIVFFEDRDAFNQLSGAVRSQRIAIPARLTVRPKERRSSRIPTVAAPAMTSGGEWTLWFLGDAGAAATALAEGPRPVAPSPTEQGASAAVRDAVPLRCQQCGMMISRDHYLPDCVASLQQQVQALRIRVEERPDGMSRCSPSMPVTEVASQPFVQVQRRPDA